MDDAGTYGKYGLLLGAGASKPFGMPDMYGLVSRVRSRLPEEHHRVWDAIASMAPPPGHDIEAVLGILEVMSHPSFPSSFACALALAHLLKLPPGSATLLEHAEAIRPFALYLHGAVQRAIGDEIGSTSCDASAVQSAYRALFSCLPGLGLSFVATTNYDTLFEALGADRPLRSGFDGNGTWVGFPSGEDDAASLDLVKLHGSVDWYVSPDPVYGRLHRSPLLIGSATRLASTDSPLPYLVLPGGTDKLGRLDPEGVAQSLVRRFADGLLDIEQLIVLGYSFRDQYLGSLILDALDANPDLTLVVVDPRAESIGDRLAPHVATGRLVTVPASFGVDGFANTMRAAVRDSLGYALVCPPEVGLARWRDEPLLQVAEDAAVVSDASALTGRAIAIPDPQRPGKWPYPIWGPYAWLETAGEYVAFFRLRVDSAGSLPPSRPLLHLEVVSRRASAPVTDDPVVLGDVRHVLSSELSATEFRTFPVGFRWNPEEWHPGSLEMRIWVSPATGPDASERISTLLVDTRWVRRTVSATAS